MSFGRALWTVALITGFVSAPAAAQAPGDSVRLTLISSETVTGGFLERSAERWRLSSATGDARLVPVTDVRRAERQVLRTRSQLRSKGMFTGMLVGAVAGVVLYSTEIGSQSSDPGLAGMLVIPLTAAGAVYGAGIGWVVGSMRPLVVWRAVR